MHARDGVRRVVSPPDCRTKSIFFLQHLLLTLEPHPSVLAKRTPYTLLLPTHFLHWNKILGILMLGNCCIWVALGNPLPVCVWKEGMGLQTTLCLGSMGSPVQGTRSPLGWGSASRGGFAVGRLTLGWEGGEEEPQSKQMPNEEGKHHTLALMCWATCSHLTPANPCHGEAISVLLYTDPPVSPLTPSHSASASPLPQEQKHSWNTLQVSCRTPQSTVFSAHSYKWGIFLTWSI